MTWRFFNTGFNSGAFNMDNDLELVKNFSGIPILRVYRWKPYCISLGANQQLDSVNQKRISDDGFDVVRRPTGGRAILHAEELTYSVVHPISADVSPKQMYREINLALKKGLVLYDSLLEKIELEHTQPHFPSFYKDS
jgi:lipoyl(octanoyl) transferase